MAVTLRPIRCTTLVVVAVLTLATWPHASHAAAAAPPPSAAPGEIDRALDRAAVWLDTLAVDSDTLTAHGIKGRKKLAEILDAELDLWRHTRDPERRTHVLARVRTLAAQTRRASYHDLRTCSDLEFREDGMSYLRVAWLLERFGITQPGYRDSIAAALPRFEEQMSTRGPWQQREFARYFVVFGLAPDRGESGAGAGVIAARTPLAQLDLDRVYDLTHEVFVREEDPAGAPARWSAVERAYLRATLPELARRAFARHDVDVGAELLDAMAECGLRDVPEFSAALGALLQAQNADGTWGRYERERLHEGDWVAQHFFLHTTMVAVDALTAVTTRPPASRAARFARTRHGG